MNFSGPRGRPAFRHILYVLLILLSGIAAYINTVFYPFVHDEIFFILNNPQLLNWDQIFSGWVQPAQLLDQYAAANRYWRPLLEVIYRVPTLFFGINPHGYHLFNVIIHLLNGLLVYRFLCLLWSDCNKAFWVALLFVIHPVQTEAVACISGISNLMLVFFLLLGLNSYCQALSCAEGSRGAGPYVISLFFFFLSLLTKEQAIIFPILVFLCDWYYSTRRQTTERKTLRYWRWIGILILIGWYIILRQAMLSGNPSLFITDQKELWLRLLAIPDRLMMDIGILIFPYGLHYFRSIDILASPVWAWLFLITEGTLITVILRLIAPDQRRTLLFSLGWFGAALLPTLNIIPVIYEYSFISAAEHFLYLPVIGFWGFVVTLVDFYWIKNFGMRHKSFLLKAGLILCVLLIGLTIHQNRYWRGEVPLFERAVRFEPRLGRLRILLARALYQEKRFEESVEQYRQALPIMQGYADRVANPQMKNLYLGFVKEILFEMGSGYDLLGKPQEALGHYQRALIIDHQDAELYNNAGIIYHKIKDWPLALSSFQEAVKLNPHHVRAMNNLALCYLEKKDYQQAESWLKKALQIDASFLPAKHNLERLYQSQPRMRKYSSP